MIGWSVLWADISGKDMSDKRGETMKEYSQSEICPKCGFIDTRCYYEPTSEYIVVTCHNCGYEMGNRACLESLRDEE